jgi:hypothetical protein
MIKPTIDKAIKFLKQFCKKENESCSQYWERLYRKCLTMVFFDTPVCKEAANSVVEAGDQTVNCKQTACLADPTDQGPPTSIMKIRSVLGLTASFAAGVLVATFVSETRISSQVKYFANAFSLSELRQQSNILRSLLDENQPKASQFLILRMQADLAYFETLASKDDRTLNKTSVCEVVGPRCQARSLPTLKKILVKLNLPKAILKSCLLGAARLLKISLRRVLRVFAKTCQM